MSADNRRHACITLDLENNWNFDDPELQYATFDYLDEYIDLIDGLDLPLSVFVVGETIEERPDAIERLQERLEVEFHLHSYTHDLSGSADLRREVRRGKQAFESFFGRQPAGYRSTQGRVDRSDLRLLESEGFQFDSSVFPTYRPGVYNNLDMPIEPYRAGDLYEIPVGVVPKLRIPLSQAYIKAIKTPFLPVLRRVPLQDVVVFNTHLQDFYHTRAHEELDYPKRFFYGRNIDAAESVFRQVVETLRRKGFSFVKMTDVYDSCTASAATERNIRQ
ncbi:polysaccharide deacetylase family protein [Haloarcula laminariae]|uniref:polysaccharide deacetylase family protein n=1 Tax=Haloarcula laminariae TaxID=2961577 RepID=UPI0021C8C114|nr:polysaccharide deacetylase family protein [Halomicroarcula laminariae]